MASTSTPSLTHIYGDKMTTLLLSDDIAALKAEIIKHTAVAQILVKRGNIYHIVGAYCLHDFGETLIYLNAAPPVSIRIDEVDEYYILST